MILHSIRLIKILSKRRSLCIILYVNCSYKTDVTSSSFQLSNQKRQPKQPLLKRITNGFCLVHKEDIREEISRTYVHITFISSCIKVIEGEAILAESIPLSIAHNTTSITEEKRTNPDEQGN